MLTTADAYYFLRNNPFSATPYLVDFYGNLEGVSENYLLSQLVIPLCTHPQLSSKIERAQFGKMKRSSIWTIFGEKENFYDLQERIEVFKELTAQSLQYALMNDWIRIDDESLSIYVLQNVATKTLRIQNQIACNLGKLVSNLSVIETFNILGAVPL